MIRGSSPRSPSRHGKTRRHFVEAVKSCQAIGVDYIDESEVLTRPMKSTTFTNTIGVPFVCRCLKGEALRIGEGAAMIRREQAILRKPLHNARTVFGEIRRLQIDAGRRVDDIRQANRCTVCAGERGLKIRAFAGRQLRCRRYCHHPPTPP